MTAKELSIRGDLLDLIDKAVDSGSDQERLDLLAAAAMRIRTMNDEHDAVCEDRAAAKAQAAALETQLAEAQPGLVAPVVAETPPGP